MKSVRIYFDERDTELVTAIAAMPKGERSARLKALLGLALAGTGGLLARVETLERAMVRLQSHTPVQSTPAPPSVSTIDAQKAALDLFRQAGAFND